MPIIIVIPCTKTRLTVTVLSIKIMPRKTVLLSITNIPSITVIPNIAITPNITRSPKPF